MIKKTILSLLFILLCNSFSFADDSIKVINDYNNTLTKNVSYNLTVIKRKFYHNNISIKNLLDEFFKSYKNTAGDYLSLNRNSNTNYIKTKPIVSLLNWFLTIESWLDNFWWRIIANNFFNITSNSLYSFINKNIFNYNINLLSSIKNIEKREYVNILLKRKSIFYCNIWSAIKNWSNIVYLSNWKDISLSIEKKYNWKRNKIWSKIAVCKSINNYLLNDNYRRNLYYLLNAKTSYVWAILPFQMMPNNFAYYLDLYNKQNWGDINLGDITFYYKFMSLFLFWNNYTKAIEKYNNHFDTPKKLKNCIKSITYDPYCIYIKKQVFRYNHANWYVKRVMNKAYDYQLIDNIWIFISPIKNISFTLYNGERLINYLIKNVKAIISQNYKWLKHRGIDITVVNNYIKDHYFTDRDNIWLVYNVLNPMKCYFIPYNANNRLSRDIWNVIFCNNKNYGILYWHIKDLSKNIKAIERNFMSKKLITKFVYQLVWKKTWLYPNWLKIKYYELKWIRPWERIAYMWDSWLNSKWLHTHYSIINMKTKRFINIPQVYDIINTIKYFR